MRYIKDSLGKNGGSNQCSLCQDQGRLPIAPHETTQPQHHPTSGHLYHPSLPHLKGITYRHHHILRAMHPIPTLIAYRRPKNLWDLLTRAELSTPPPSPLGTTPCERSRCKTCLTIITSSSFFSHHTGRQYTIRDSTSCKYSNLVYLIQCRSCGCQYIGETNQALNEEMNSHRACRYINRKTEACGCPLHITQPHH